MLSLLSRPDSWFALATLSVLEIVLGIDNLIVLSILVAAAPLPMRRKVRNVGLSLALLMRLALLYSIVWLTGLRAPWFTIAGRAISPRELILGIGGAALLIKSASELRRALEPPGALRRAVRGPAFIVLVLQIAAIDVLFSLDSVFAAVGLARPDQIAIMAAAIVIAMLAMLWVSGPAASLIEHYPGIKTLALASLALIGASLIGQAIGLELPKGYLYCAIAFALAVELLNMRRR
jgi:predicted tellurium resistance membrane protein TerC